MTDETWSHLDFGISLPDLGVYHLTIQEAAELIAIDLWVNGEIEGTPELDEDHHMDTSDPRLKVALTNTIKLFKDRLSKAVDTGSLKAEIVRRDFDERLLAEYTFLSKEELIAWLSERGHMTDVAFEEWDELQGEIYMGLLYEADALRAIGKGGHRAVRGYVRGKSHLSAPVEGDAENADPGEVIAWLQQSLAENARLKGQLAEVERAQAERAVRPLMTRERDTLLTLVAVLCGEAGIDYKRPAKAAGVIRGIAAQMGVSIGETTIENHLKKIPDALSERLR